MLSSEESYDSNDSDSINSSMFLKYQIETAVSFHVYINMPFEDPNKK